MLEQRVHDELADLMEMTEEINGAMAQGLGQVDVDESELDDELAALGDDLLDADADAAPSYLDAVSAGPAPAAPQAEALTAGGGSDAADVAAAPRSGGGSLAFPDIPVRATN